VVWETADEAFNVHVMAQKYDSDGSRFGPQMEVSDYVDTYESHPDVSTAPDGRFVVVWCNYGRDGDQYGVFARRYDSSGSAEGPSFQVNTNTPGEQRGASVSMAPDGGFVVVWSSGNFGQQPSQDGFGMGVFGQRFGPDGEFLGSEFQVNTTTDNDESACDVDQSADGAFVVVWVSRDRGGHPWLIYGQRFDAVGNPVGPEFDPHTQAQGDHLCGSVAVANDGSFVVTWESRESNGTYWDVFGRIFDPNGSPLGPEFRMNLYTNNNQIVGSADTVSNGNFVAVWQSLQQDGDDFGIFAQRFDASGSPLGRLPW
jgi:hypothetical protein